MNLPSTLRRYARYIRDLDRDQAGWSVGLKPGWFCVTTETHAIHETTLAAIAVRLKYDLIPCECQECSRLRQQAAERADRELGIL